MAATTTLRVTEAAWQRTVTDLAELYGWTWAHFRPAQTSKGWRTAVAGPGGKGFPDLVLWRERVIFVELKAGRGKPSPEQEQVAHGLLGAGAELYCWWPDDFDEAHAVLRRGR